MSRPSHREAILNAGLQVMHKRGYSNTSVRDIAAAADVPIGSFTNHFRSKEAFGLEVLNLYYSSNRELFLDTLLNDNKPPLKRLREWIDVTDATLNQADAWNGCLLGNFGIEASDETITIQKRAGEIFKEVEGHIEYCLKAAVKAGEIPIKTDCAELASFVLGSLQGALLLGKAQRSSAPMKRFKHVLFASLIHK
jgi:TetR/AcrR family transcriptional regulator, transcriptional repressor for nem operon